MLCKYYEVFHVMRGSPSYPHSVCGWIDAKVCKVMISLRTDDLEWSSVWCNHRLPLSTTANKSVKEPYVLSNDPYNQCSGIVCFYCSIYLNVSHFFLFFLRCPKCWLPFSSIRKSNNGLILEILTFASSPVERFGLFCCISGTLTLHPRPSHGPTRCIPGVLAALESLPQNPSTITTIATAIKGIISNNLLLLTLHLWNPQAHGWVMHPELAQEEPQVRCLRRPLVSANRSISLLSLRALQEVQPRQMPSCHLFQEELLLLLRR